MRNENNQEENKDLRLITKQLKITNGRVIRELREINERLGNSK